MTSNEKKICKQIMREAKFQDYSPYRIAQDIGVSKSAIYRWRDNKMSLSEGNVKKIVKLLGGTYSQAKVEFPKET